MQFAFPKQFNFTPRMRLALVLVFVLPWQISCMLQASVTKKDSTSPTIKAAKLVFQMEPSGGLTGEVWPQQPVIMVVDEQGNLVASGPDAFAPITVSFLDGSNALYGKTTITAEKGIAKFTDLNASVSGLKQLVVTKADLTNADGQSALSSTSVPFVVTANSAAKLSLSLNSNIVAGACAAANVILADRFGNPATTNAAVSFELYGAGSGSFYSDNTCATAITSGQIAPSTSSAQVHYKNNFQEKLNLGVYDPAANFASTITTVPVAKTGISKFTIQKAMGGADVVGCTLYTNGAVYCNSQPIAVPLPAVDITSGDNFSCALLNNASVYCWGDNNVGQLGQGSTATFPNPVLVNLGGPVVQVSSGGRHTCAIVTIASVATLKCWGGNDRRQMGDGTTTARMSPVVPSAVSLPGGAYPQKLSVQTDAEDGATKNFLVLTDGSVYSWGDAQAPAAVAGLANVIQLASDATGGTTTTCALLADQSVQCFGSNSLGQYGNGTTTSSASPITIANYAGSLEIAVSSGQVCARSAADNSLYCSGSTHYYDTFANEALEFPRLTPRLMFSGLKFKSFTSNFSLNCGLSEEADPQILCFRSRFYSNSYPYYISVLPSALALKTSSQTRIGLVLTATESAVGKDECLPLTLTFQKNGSNAAAESQIDFTLSDSQGLGQFYTSSTCAAGTEIVRGYFPVGLTSRTFYLKSTTTLTSPRWAFLKATPTDPVFFGGYLGLTYSGPIAALRIIGSSYDSTYTEYYSPVRLLDAEGNRTSRNSSLNITLTSDYYPVLRFLTGYTGTALPNASTQVIPADRSMFKIYVAVDECQGGNATVSIPELNISDTRAFNGECYPN